MPEFTWVATAALDGAVLADLPKLDVPRVKKIIGRYEPATATLPLVGRGVPENWERVLTGGASCFHLLRENPDDPAHGIPVWGGMIMDDPLTEADRVDFSLQTIEGYFDRRYVGDELYTNIGQNLIVKDLVEKYAAAGPNDGIPIRVVIVNGGNGKIRTREYKDADDKSLYSVLSDLMGVIDGPEWTVGWEWKSGPERITPVLYVGDRIGSAVTAGLGPAAVFEMPGAVTSFQRHRSYARGKGANTVRAVSSGQGDVRPESDLIVTTDPIRPTFEYRFTPSTSIKETATLNEHATSAATALAGGTVTLALTAIVDSAPRLDVDWFIGDDVGYRIGGNDRTDLTFDGAGYANLAAGMGPDSEGYAEPGSLELDTVNYLGNGAGTPVVPAFPRGYAGTARAIGWELAPQGTATITPILAGGDLT